MTVSIDEMRNWLGLTQLEFQDAEIGEMLAMSYEYCSTWCAGKGIGSSGVGFDIAMRYFCASLIYRAMDARGIKTAEIITAGLRISSDMATAVKEFEDRSELALKTSLKAQGNRRDQLIRHSRSGFQS